MMVPSGSARLTQSGIGLLLTFSFGTGQGCQAGIDQPADQNQYCSYQQAEAERVPVFAGQSAAPTLVFVGRAACQACHHALHLPAVIVGAYDRLRPTAAGRSEWQPP